MAKEKETATEIAEPAATVLTFDQRLALARAGMPLAQLTELTAAGVTFEQMLELAEAIRGATAGQSNSSAAEVAQAMAKAQIEAADFLADRDRKERNGPNVSAFNPQGEREHPRPDIQGDIFWLGTKLHKAELTEAEIALVNRLKPGVYHGGQWKVTDQSGGTGARSLLVWFPNEEQDDRSNLPPSMVAMLEEMVGAAATPVLA